MEYFFETILEERKLGFRSESFPLPQSGKIEEKETAVGTELTAIRTIL